MEVVVDVQGFKKSGNRFIFKEVAVVAVEEDAVPSVFVFRPPHEWRYLLPEHKNVNRWLEYYWHGIPWTSGEIPYQRLKEIIEDSCGNATKIWVKGLEKAKWLQEILPHKFICNVEDIGCPSLLKLAKACHLSPSCSHHTLLRWRQVCAIDNVKMIKEWIIEDRESSEMDTNCSFSSLNSAAVSSFEDIENIKPQIKKEILYSMYS